MQTGQLRGETLPAGRPWHPQRSNSATLLPARIRSGSRSINCDCRRQRRDASSRRKRKCRSSERTGSSAAAGYPAFCRRRRSARVMRRRSAIAIRRSGSSRSLSAIGHSYPHAWQHHIIVTDAPRIVCSGRTRPMTPHWRHFSGNRSRRKLGDTGENHGITTRSRCFHANSLCLNALRTYIILRDANGTGRRSWSSVLTQCIHGIHATGAPRRNDCGEHGSGDEH